MLMYCVRAGVRVMDQPALLGGLALVQGLPQRIGYEVRAQVRRRPPAHDAPGKHVDAEGHVDESLPSRDIREKSDSYSGLGRSAWNGRFTLSDGKDTAVSATVVRTTLLRRRGQPA